jgi:hypothetical protein
MIQEMLPPLPNPAPPVVIFNKSHSGSRLLVQLLQDSGVFMGSQLNESGDALALLDLLRHLVVEYYPDYAPLWQTGFEDPRLAAFIAAAFPAHLAGCPESGPWGWKLCETTYILPVIDALFPGARYIHLIRDGRDVAFSDHRAPHAPFWKKVYFNTGSIERWGRLSMTKAAYQRRSHVYNALHWVNSVQVGRTCGSMLRQRYLEVRYENLCRQFPQQARRILDFLGLPADPGVIHSLAGEVRLASIGKYKRQPAWKIKEVLEVAKPLLLSLGYLQEDPPAAGWISRLRR